MTNYGRLTRVPMAQSDYPSTPVTVVIGEADPDLGDLYATWLTETETDSYNVQTASDADTLLALLDETVDVVVMNRQLAGTSSEDIVALIQQHDLTCGIVLVSGIVPDFDLLEMTFDAYLLKPVDAAELRDAVSRARAAATAVEDVRERQQLQATANALEDVKRDAILRNHEDYTVLQDRIAALQTESGRSARTSDNPDSDPSDDSSDTTSHGTDTSETERS